MKKDCEFVMFTQGDVFCSLTPEELEEERQEARLLYEKYIELMLLEESSNMSLMDFFDRWMRYSDAPDKPEWKTEYEQKLMEDREDWNSYKYRMNTYDREKATEKKLVLWRRIHMVEDHAWLISLGIISYLLWSDPVWKVWSYVAIILFALNVFGTLYKWTTYFSNKKWEVT